MRDDLDYLKPPRTLQALVCNERDLFRTLYDAALSKRFGVAPEVDWVFGEPLAVNAVGGFTHAVRDCLLLGREGAFRNWRTFLLPIIYSELLSIPDLTAWRKHFPVYLDTYAQFFGTSDRPAFIWVNPVWRPWGFLTPDQSHSLVTTEASTELARLPKTPRRVAMELAPGVAPVEFAVRELVFAYRTVSDPRVVMPVRRQGTGRQYNLAVFDAPDVARLCRGPQSDVMRIPVYADHYRATPRSSKKVLGTPVVMLGTLHEDAVLGGKVRYLTDRIHPGNAELIAWSGAVRSFSRLMSDYPWLRDLLSRAAK